MNWILHHGRPFGEPLLFGLHTVGAVQSAITPFPEDAYHLEGVPCQRCSHDT